MDFGDWLSIALCLFFPVFAVWGAKRGLFPSWLSSIIACYAIGILVANLRVWPVDAQLVEGIAGASMVVGLPLLLFTVRLRGGLPGAKPMLVSFALCCLGGLLATGATGIYLAGTYPDGWRVAGMLTGLYTGGTPNVQAIGIALSAPADYVVLIQAADVLLGGAYLFGLVTFLPALYARWYPAHETLTGRDDEDMERVPGTLARQLTFGIAVSAASVGLTFLLTGMLNATVLILTLTTLSLLVANTRLSERIGDSYAAGEFFVLIFSVALGLLADFRQLAAEGLDLLYFSAFALGGTTLFHLLICKVFRIDRDTMILSYVAAAYGPVFVAQVATAIGNRRLLAAGIMASLIGFGVGNYLGIGLAYLVRAMVM